MSFSTTTFDIAESWMLYINECVLPNTPITRHSPLKLSFHPSEIRLLSMVYRHLGEVGEYQLKIELNMATFFYIEALRTTSWAD